MALDHRSAVDPEVVFMSLRLLTPGIDGTKYRSSAPCRTCGGCSDGSDKNGARKRRRLLTAGDSEWNIDTLFSDFHARLGALQAELLAQHTAAVKQGRRHHGDSRRGSDAEVAARIGGGGGHSPYFPEPSLTVPAAASPTAGSGPQTPIARRSSGAHNMFPAIASSGAHAQRPRVMPVGLQEHIEARFGHAARTWSGGSANAPREWQRRYDAARMQHDATLGLGLGGRSLAAAHAAASSSASSPNFTPLTNGVDVVPSAIRHHHVDSNHRPPTPPQSASVAASASVSASAAPIGPNVELTQRSSAAAASSSASPKASRAQRPAASSSGPVDREKCVYCDVLYHPNKLSEHFEVHCNLRFVCTCGREYQRFNSLRSHVKDKKCAWNRAAHQPQLDILARRFNLCYKLSHAELSAKVDEWATLPPGAETHEERAAKAKALEAEAAQLPSAKRHKRKRSSGAAGEERSAGGSGDDEEPPAQAPASPATQSVAVPSTPSRVGLSSRFSQNGTSSSPVDISSSSNEGENGRDHRYASPRSGSVGAGEGADDRRSASPSPSLSSSRSSPTSSRSSSRDRSSHAERTSGSASVAGLPTPTSIAPPVFLRSSDKSAHSSGTVLLKTSNPSGTFGSDGSGSVSASPSITKSAAAVSGGSPSKSVATRKSLTLPNAQRICKACDKHFSPTSPCDCVLSNQKRHVCTTCGRGFNLKYALVQHEKTVHTTARPFSCRICNASYKWKRGLVRHYRRTHKQTFGAQPRGRPRVSLPGDATEPHPMADDDADVDAQLSPPDARRRQSNSPAGSLASLIGLGGSQRPNGAAYGHHHGDSLSLPSALPPAPSPSDSLSSRRLSESQLSLFLQRANPFGSTTSLASQSGGGLGLARHLEMDHIVRNGVATALMHSHGGAAHASSLSRSNTPRMSPAAGVTFRSSPMLVKIDPDTSAAEAVPGSDAGGCGLGGSGSRDITPSRTPELPMAMAVSTPAAGASSRSSHIPYSIATMPVLKSWTSNSTSAVRGGQSGSSTSSGQSSAPSAAPRSRSPRRRDIPPLEKESDDNTPCRDGATSVRSSATASSSVTSTSTSAG